LVLPNFPHGRGSPKLSIHRLAIPAFLELYHLEDPAVGPLELRHIHLDELAALEHPAEILPSHPEVFAASVSVKLRAQL